MRWFYKQFMLMEEDKEKGGGGGGGDDKEKNKPSDHAKEIAELKAQNASIMERLDKALGKSKGTDDEEGDDLKEKARKQRESDDKRSSDNKALEAALKFSMGANDWLKNNQSLLPKDISDIFKAAEKENYETAIEKDSAIKAGIIQSFFSVQSNLDLLTPALKSNLEDYLKLTKTGKQEKAQQIYDAIFEPSFEMLRRVKKAEAVNKGFGNSSDSDSAYKTKLMAGSRKHFLGEKTDGA